MKNKEIIGIIGGGASGLVAAINAKNDNNEVVIFENNTECGKKILATGNGRCNFWNEDFSSKHFESKSSNFEELFNGVDALKFFEDIGVYSKIKNGYYYPASNQAVSIRNLLNSLCNKKNIVIKNEVLIKEVKKDSCFTLISDNEEFRVDKLILATGSKASNVAGSLGIGYEILSSFNHSIRKVLPALVPLNCEGNFKKIWDGVRSDAKVSLVVDGNIIKEEIGEIQLTKDGISGICVFNLSNLALRSLDEGKSVYCEIDFLPNIDDLNIFINEETSRLNIRAYDVLINLLNYKLVDSIFSLNKNEDELINLFKHFKVQITGSKDYLFAQVCSGGVNLDEVNLTTMESKLVSGLYITGELLDICGDCGGYNLGIAWCSGIKAGKSAGGND